MLRDAHRKRAIVDCTEQGLDVIPHHLVERRGLGSMAPIDAPVRRRSSAAAWYRACRATMPVDERALQALRPLTSHAAEMAERSTAGTLDLAFRHADSPTFEGEAPRVALVCAVWGPLIVGESAR